MPYQNPRNADDLKLQELQKERTTLQAAIKKGTPTNEYTKVADMVTRLRVVNHELNGLYIKRHGL